MVLRDTSRDGRLHETPIVRPAHPRQLVPNHNHQPLKRPVLVEDLQTVGAGVFREPAATLAGGCSKLEGWKALWSMILRDKRSWT